MSIVATRLTPATPGRLALPLLPDAAASPCRPRLRPPPWDEASADWQRIDRRLQPDHLARRLAGAVERLDPAELADLYAGTGSPAYPPALLLCAALCEMQRGQHSPARWARDARECEPLRWLLRGCEPSRSAWYAFRDRLAGVLEALNGRLLHEAVQQGWTPAQRGALDGTLVAANASRHKLLGVEKLQQRLQQLQQAAGAATVAPQAPPEAPVEAKPAEAAPAEAKPAWLAPTPAGRERQRRRYRCSLQRMEQLQQRNGQKRPDKRKAKAKVLLSACDPEAALGRDKDKVYRPLYNVQVLDDLDSPLVLCYDVFAQQNDAGTLGPMLARAEQLSGRALRLLLADAGYACGPHLSAAAAAGVVVYAPWRENDASGKGRGQDKQIPKSAFTWEASQQAYRCPAGHVLQDRGLRKYRRSDGTSEQVRQHRCPAEHCRACPQQARCAPGAPAGRTIHRWENEELVEALRERMASAEAKELYRLRRQTVELVNADWKEQRRLRRFSGRGLRRARAQVGLMVLGHNLLACETLRASGAPPRVATAQKQPA